MPLGGIGTGNVAICGDGSLRQWQLHNIGNHAGSLPWSFFALRVSRIEPPLDTIRILQAPVPERTHTPLVTDDEAPGWQHDLLAAHRGVDDVSFQATYPFARLRYLDDELPVDVSLEAFTPLVLHEVERSSLPVAMFTFRLENRDDFYLRGTLGAALQNAVGWDGVTPIDGVHGAGYGGNVNRVSRRGGWTSLVLENPSLPTDAPGYGQLVLAADDPWGIALEQWRRPEEFVAFLASHGLADGRSRLDLDPTPGDPAKSAPRTHAGPSAAGSTWNGGLGVRFDLQPGESRTVRMLLAWSFPNRFVNFEQFGPPKPEWGGSRFWLGNRYTTVHGDAAAVARRVEGEWDELRDASLAWPSTLEASTLDAGTVEHLAAQVSLVRSPTCFQTADGRFFGFEGVMGASTVMWSGAFGGSCPLNCTHVWNYEQALAKTFPELERSMRETELDVMQAPEGYIPHRVISPVYLRQLWGEPIGGPEEPALDGMLGTVLKTYREVRAGAGEDWLARYWPKIVRLLAHVESKWVRDERGVLSGIQPSTHDIDLTGINSFMGTLWLAALRAAEELALRAGDDGAAGRYRELFERASRSYDEALFDGEYYVQRLEPGDSPEFQWLEGCLSDQVIGQWWAHELGLGHILPAEHVRSALRAVVRHNLRTGFDGFEHPFRVFADGADSGLLMCTWPRGGRPDVPTRYCDEVWTGIEYQVAAHCFREGLDEEGRRVVSALWARYDGTRRNPFNEIECGDHYARAMAGWSVLDALGGVRYDAPARALELRAPEPGASLPFVAGESFGLVTAFDDEVELSCAGGRLELAALTLQDVRHDFSPPVTLEHGRRLRVARRAEADLTLQGAHD
ncbi:MAG TPA: GH116 family glycosyl-hydrolase [Gaiellaceae bacterium]|nr:GH116 family glycosyl-hydrolase [Gaiellaceae bacterium]